MDSVDWLAFSLLHMVSKTSRVLKAQSSSRKCNDFLRLLDWKETGGFHHGKRDLGVYSGSRHTTAIVHSIDPVMQLVPAAGISDYSFFQLLAIHKKNKWEMRQPESTHLHGRWSNDWHFA